MKLVVCWSVTEGYSSPMRELLNSPRLTGAVLGGLLDCVGTSILTLPAARTAVVVGCPTCDTPSRALGLRLTSQAVCRIPASCITGRCSILMRAQA